MSRFSNRCKRKSELNHSSVAMLIISIFTIISTCNIAHSEALPFAAEEEKICFEEECIHSASRILKFMDQKVNPCDNFYKFACGGFLNSTYIPEDKTSVTSFQAITDDLTQLLKTSIEEPSGPKEPKPFSLVKNLYKSCLNLSNIDNQGFQPLVNVLKELGGWPVLDGKAWNDKAFDWKNSMYKLREIGYSYDYFISLGISSDEKNNSRRILNIDQTSLGLPREYLVKGMQDKNVEAYYTFMVDVAVMLGASRAEAEKELLESLKFEMKLADICLPMEDRRDSNKLYNLMKVADLNKNYKSIPWEEYINKLLTQNVQVNKGTQVIVKVPSFIKSFEQVLQETPKRVQANYAMWRVAFASASYLNEQIRNSQLKFKKVTSGIQSLPPRWKECVSRVANSLPISVGAIYVRKHFREDAKNIATAMVAKIRQAFVDNLEKIDWMDEKTKKNAFQKAASMLSFVAYPDELLDNAELEKYFERLNFEGDNYLEKMRNLSLFTTNKSFEELNKPVNKSDWAEHSYPAVVNAFYSPNENSIQFPAGILQGAFFHKERPRYMNYGAIGYVIGHEITHGFDDEGRQYDKDGNLAEWWAEETKKKYLEKTKCIIDQYGNFKSEEVNLNLNGVNTQGENIADNGGIKMAYQAYLKWLEQNSMEPKLPGLRFNPRQLFWISAANVWCSRYRPEAMKNLILTGVHSPAEFRIIGPFSNMPQFSQDFNCPINSKMNPKNKCIVW